jgi:hypothetical protein
MAVEQLSKDTLSITELEWRGDGFSEPAATKMWRELPEALREIATREIVRGNEPWNILRNDERGVVLLAFRNPPAEAPGADTAIRVHRSFEYGNYCYDGTFCTYEHLPSGSFLAFDDPEWQDEA